MLPTQRADGAVGQLGARVQDYDRAGELKCGDAFGPALRQTRTKMNSDGLDASRFDPNQGANSLTAGRSHIIRASLDVLAERHF